MVRDITVSLSVLAFFEALNTRGAYDTGRFHISVCFIHLVSPVLIVIM